MFAENYLDRWTEVKNGLAYDVYVTADLEQSPNEYTTRDESPELFKALESGEVRYVGLEVRLSIAPYFSASLWGIEYGSCSGWADDVDRRHLQEHYVPDLITEVLAEVRKRSDALRLMLEVAEKAN